MTGLDVHILLHPATPKDWQTRCLESAHEAALLAGFPVALHPLPIQGEHIGRDRLRGYALGEHTFVATVDDDDWLDRNAFAVLADALARNPVAVATRSFAHQNNHTWVLPWRTNLRVFRRDVAASAPLEDWPVYDGPAMLAHADTLGEVIEVNQPVYHYRLHSSNHRKLVARASPEMLARIRALPRGIHLARSA